MSEAKRARAASKGIAWIPESFIPREWTDQLKKAGFTVEQFDMYNRSYYKVGKHSCFWVMRTAKNQDNPEWEVGWDVVIRNREDAEAFGSNLAIKTVREDAAFVPVYMLGRHDEADDNVWERKKDGYGTSWWMDSRTYDNLRDAREDLNEWIWCVEEFRTLRNALLDDLFLKEFTLAGGRLWVEPFPSRRYAEAYPIATFRYGTTTVEVVYNHDSGLYTISGGPRRSDFGDPKRLHIALHRRAKQYLKGM